MILNGSYIPLTTMIATVEQYILLKKGVQVTINPPRNDEELQMLGLAFDIATAGLGMNFTYTFS